MAFDQELFSNPGFGPRFMGVGGSALLTRMPGHSSERAELARRILWWAYGLLGLALVAYVISVFARPAGSSITWLDGWGVNVFEVVLSAMCIARGFVRQRGRAIAFTLGAAALCWAVGDIILTVESMNGATPPSPSWADLTYLLFYPLAYVGIVLLMRRELKRISPPSLLDGAVAGLGVAALCAAFAFHSIVHTAGGSALVGCDEPRVPDRRRAAARLSW